MATTKRAKAHKPPLTLSQQRFRLAVLLIAALPSAIAGIVHFTKDGSALQTALILMVGTAIVEPLRSAFRRYFPQPKDEPPEPPHG